MGNLKISEIEIIPLVPRKGRIASLSFVLNGMFKITNVSIYTRLDGNLRLVYPTKILPNGKEDACFKPIKKEVGKDLEEVLIETYKAFVFDKAIEEDIREHGLGY